MKSPDVTRLTQMIADLQAKIKTYGSTLDSIEKESNQLTFALMSLEDNLKFLKKRHIVAMASEYKKIKEDMNRAKKRLADLKTDHSNISRVNREVLGFLDKAEKEILRHSSAPNNVLKFEKKDG